MRRRRALAFVAALATMLSGFAAAKAELLEDLRGPLTGAREEAEGLLEHSRVDALEKLDHEVPYAGVVNLSGQPEPKTVYFHARAPLSTVDEADEFTGGQGPYMDPSPPTAATPKAATSTGAGNLGFRKNPLNAYWGGQVTGVITADPTVTFWLEAPGAGQAVVAIFGDGGIGVASPLATKIVNVSAPAPTRVDATFTGLEATIQTELVVQISMNSPPVSNNTTGKVLFDSVDYPSSFSFTLLPIGGLPRLDDPIGIVFRDADLIAANAGTGDIVRIAGGAPAQVIKGGLVPGGFARGVTGLALDAGGNLYAAVAETGEVLFVTPAGVSGVYARGLGAPIGIAFDAAGNLFAADHGGRRVVKVTPSRTVSTLASLAERPYGIAVAPDGTVTVSTQGLAGSAFLNDVKIYSVAPDGAVSLVKLLSDAHSAEGLAYGASGNLYIGSGRSGRLLRLTPAPAGALQELATGLGGPINLAFGSGGLIVATQGEGRTGGDAILTIDVGEAGAALAAPALSPTALPASPRVWVHRAGAQAIDPATFPGPLPEAELRSVGQNGFEPTMGVQNDGDVFIVGGDFDVAGAGASPKVYRSRDAGGTWTDVTPKDLLGRGEDAPPLTLDPYLWVDTATDRVFTIDTLWGCHYMSFSDDSGQTWTSSPLACGVPPIDHQTFVGGRPHVSTTQGYPNVLYHCSNWVADSPCGRSLDGGRTWQPAGVAYVATDAHNRPGEFGGLFCGGLTSHLVTDPEGRVFLPKGHCGRPYVSVSEDDGLTWQLYPVSTTRPTNNHETAIASDTAGNLYYVWIGNDRLPYLSVSTDHGRTWGPERMIGPPGLTEANIPTITAGRAGGIAVLYMGTTTDYGYGARNYGKAGWSGYITVSTNALDGDPVFTSTTANPLTDPLIRGNCGPGRCGNVFDFLDVIVAPDGRVWGTFVDTCTGPCSSNRSAASTDGKVAVAPLRIGPNLLTGLALTPV